MKSITAPVLLAVVLFTVAPVTDVYAAGCEADHECLENHYCYKKTGYCTQCTNCRLYKRHVSLRLTCPKSARDCGNCIYGYVDEYLLDGTRRELCQLSPTVGTTPGTDIAVDNSNVGSATIIAAAIASFSLLFLVAGCTFMCYKKRKYFARLFKRYHGDPPNVEDDNELPPGYTPRTEVDLLMRRASAPPMEPDSSRSTRNPSPVSSYCGYVKYQAGETMQKAVPFVNPQNPYRGSINEDSDDQDNDEDHVAHHSPPPLDDENTMPSNWAPPPDYGNAHNDSGTSDLGGSTAGACPTPNSGSEVSLDGPPLPAVQLNFSGLISQLRPASPETATRPAKRQRLDSGAASGSSSYESDETESDECTGGSQPANQTAFVVNNNNQPVNVVTVVLTNNINLISNNQNV